MQISEVSGHGIRIDALLRDMSVYSKLTAARNAIRRGEVRVNDVKIRNPDHIYHAGEKLSISIKGEVYLINLIEAKSEQ